jgi:hypothetical protein
LGKDLAENAGIDFELGKSTIRLYNSRSSGNKKSYDFFKVINRKADRDCSWIKVPGAQDLAWLYCSSAGESSEVKKILQILSSNAIEGTEKLLMSKTVLSEPV